MRQPVGDNDGPASNKTARTKQAHARRQNRYRYMLPYDMPHGEYWDEGAMVGSPAVAAVVAVPVSQNFSPRNATSIRIPLQETARGVVCQ